MYFTPKRLKLYLWALLVLEFIICLGFRSSIRSGAIDFRVYYTAGHMLRTGHAALLYDYPTEAAPPEHPRRPRNPSRFLFFAPPFAALPFALLSFAPYLWALLLFASSTSRSSPSPSASCALTSAHSLPDGHLRPRSSSSPSFPSASRSSWASSPSLVLLICLPRLRRCSKPAVLSSPASSSRSHSSSSRSPSLSLFSSSSGDAGASHSASSREQRSSPHSPSAIIGAAQLSLLYLHSVIQHVFTRRNPLQSTAASSRAAWPTSTASSSRSRPPTASRRSSPRRLASSHPLGRDPPSLIPARAPRRHARQLPPLPLRPHAPPAAHQPSLQSPLRRRHRNLHSSHHNTAPGSSATAASILFCSLGVFLISPRSSRSSSTTSSSSSHSPSLRSPRARSIGPPLHFRGHPPPARSPTQLSLTSFNSPARN